MDTNAVSSFLSCPRTRHFSPASRRSSCSTVAPGYQQTWCLFGWVCNCLPLPFPTILWLRKYGWHLFISVNRSQDDGYVSSTLACFTNLVLFNPIRFCSAWECESLFIYCLDSIRVSYIILSTIQISDASNDWPWLKYMAIYPLLTSLISLGDSLENSLAGKRPLLNPSLYFIVKFII